EGKPRCKHRFDCRVFCYYETKNHCYIFKTGFLLDSLKFPPSLWTSKVSATFTMLICSRNFLENVGVPRIACYDGIAFIQMCQVDHGRDKYGNQPESLRRVFLLTWMATFTIGYFMMQEIAKLGEADEMLCREELCENVITRYNQEAADLVKE